MPLYPFPDVPQVPGVPSLVRSGAAATAITISLTTLASLLLNKVDAETRWGIYDAAGQQLGGVGRLTLVEGLTQQGSILSTVSVDYSKETRISDFPVQGGGFATFNKVELPATPTVVLNLSGDEAARSAFLFSINDACLSTDLYSVVTPEVTYVNYSIVRYSYPRSAAKGANLLRIEIALEEVRQVSATYATATPITSPQNVGATSQVSGGTVQPVAPTQSTLLQLMNKLASLKGTN